MTDNDKAIVEWLSAEADQWDEPKSHDETDMRGMLYRAKDRIEAQAAEIERLLDYDEAKANALHNTLNQLANAEQEIERIKDRLGWICAVMDLDDEVTLQWIYTELQALRGAE